MHVCIQQGNMNKYGALVQVRAAQSTQGCCICVLVRSAPAYWRLLALVSARRGVSALWCACTFLSWWSICRPGMSWPTTRRACTLHLWSSAVLPILIYSLRLRKCQLCGKLALPVPGRALQRLLVSILSISYTLLSLTHKIHTCIQLLRISTVEPLKIQ